MFIYVLLIICHFLVSELYKTNLFFLMLQKKKRKRLIITNKLLVIVLLLKYLALIKYSSYIVCPMIGKND